MEGKNGKAIEVSCAWCGDVVSVANHSSQYISKQPICARCYNDVGQALGCCECPLTFPTATLLGVHEDETGHGKRRNE